MVKTLKITKTGLEFELPLSFKISLEFYGYDKPLKCTGNKKSFVNEASFMNKTSLVQIISKSHFLKAVKNSFLEVTGSAEATECWVCT